MRVLVYFIIVTLLGCSSDSQSANAQRETIISAAKIDTSQQIPEQEADFREEYISLYQKPVLIDSSFVDNGKKYRIVFHHFSTMDSGLVVPAKYNFDTNKDFVTHNFVSDLTLLLGKDTVFQKQISKTMFSNLLNTLETPLNKFATLLYPTLDINKDSIKINYSISIPVTDVGIRANIKFDMKGNYVITQ